MAKTQNDLGRDSVGRLLFKLAVPAITAQLVNMLYNIVDRIYIGHMAGVGATALTGVGVTFPIIMIISAFSSLIGMGGAPRASIKMGQKRDDEAENILGNCVTGLLFISVVLTVFFFFFKEKLLLLFGASSVTLPYALGYMDIYICGTVFVQLALGLNPFITTQGFATTGMLTVVIGAVTNIVLDPILIFGLDMGVQGAALATIISQAVSAVWVVWFLSSRRSKLRIRPHSLKPRAKILLPVLALGCSPFIMQATESMVSVSLNSSLQRYGGDIAVGSMAILSSLMQILMLPLTGLTQGAQPIIGFNYGAQQNDRVKKAFKLLLISSMGYAVLFWGLMMLAPKPFIAIFTSDKALAAATVSALRVYLGAGFILGAQIACQQTFIAVGQAKISLFLALLRKIFLLIPLIYIMPALLSDKVFAVFFAEPVADIIATLTTVITFSVQFKKILARNDPSLHSPKTGPQPAR